MIPVVVGVGQVVQRQADPGLDAVGLMVEAAQRACADAGDPGLFGRRQWTGAVLVPEGTWRHADAGRLVAAALGAPEARTVLARVGVLQTTLLARAATMVAEGEVDLALVVGGEDRARTRATAAARGPDRVAPGGMAKDGRPPDEVLAPATQIVTALEVERGLAVPAQSYAVQEEALRRRHGEGPDEHRARLAACWAGFSAVAAANPYAWDGASAHDAASIGDPAAPGNRMVATPYTRRHCSQWNVDQAAAILLCPARVADELGVAAERRVHPLAVAGSDATITLTRRAELHRSPGFAAVGRALAAATGVDPASADHVELYSCFPSAVRIQQEELGLTRREGPLTVTGGMTFAGGPLNSAVLHSLATMVDVLRADPGTTGLVDAVSGMMTKQAGSLWSTEPPSGGFADVDVTEEAAAATAVVEVDPAHRGELVVDGATVAYDRDGPTVAVVVGTTPDGRRAVATTDDRDRCAALAAEPPTGEVVRVDGPRLAAG